MSDFLRILLDRKQAISEEYSSIHRALTQPEYHVAYLQQTLKDAAEQFAALPDDPDILKGETLSLLQQIPVAFDANWNRIVSLRNNLTVKMSEIDEMIETYKKWHEEEEARKLSEKEARKKKRELKKDIKDGKVKEPSRKTGRKRKVGTRPPTSLKKFRKAQSDLSSSEDSEG